MLPSLVWLNELHACLNRALDGQITSFLVLETADPLKKIGRMTLRPELSAKNYPSLQRLAHAFAEANQCTLERIRRDGPHLLFEVSIRRRLGPVMNKNPLLAKK